MSLRPDGEQDRKQYWLNLTLAGAAGQVGCITLIIVIAAVLGGLWLDSLLGTRPVFTLILLVVSIPVSLGVMLYTVRLLTNKIKANLPPQSSRPAQDMVKPEAVVREGEREQGG